MLASTVSSKFLAYMAASEGFRYTMFKGHRSELCRMLPHLYICSSHSLRRAVGRFEETLTGFKWLGNRAIELEQEGLKVSCVKQVFSS